MPSLVHLAYALCAAILIAYLAGWPVSVAFGTSARRLRLFVIGAGAAGCALYLTGTPWFGAIFASLLGAGLAVGFAEVAFSGPLVPAAQRQVRISSAKTAPSPSEGIPELEWVVEEETPGDETDDHFAEARTFRPPARTSQPKQGGILGPLGGGTIHGAPAPKSLLGPLALRGQDARACPRCGTSNAETDSTCRECHGEL